MLNKKAHQLAGQCKKRRHSSQNCNHTKCSENIYARTRACRHTPMCDYNNTKIAISVMRRRLQVHWSHISELRSKKNVEWIIQQEMKHLNHSFQNFKPFQHPLNRYQEIVTWDDTKRRQLCDLLPTGIS